MILYRLGGDFKKGEISYRIDQITGNRLDIGLIDQYSLDRLARLVNGGLCHINDLYAAEMALRGLIFHDSTEAITPSAKVQILSLEGPPFVTSISPDTDDSSALQEVLEKSGFKVQLCGIDQLIGFTDESKAKSFIKQHERKRLAKLIAEKEWHTENDIPLPTFSLNPEMVPIEYVANDEGKFFEVMLTSESSAVKRFLKPLALSGYASYIGNPNVRSRYEKLRNYNAEQFFGILDREWEAHYNKLKRVLNIPIPLFVTLVLNRARNRESIPNEILLLKNEFAEARRQLWDLFDEADFRIYDTSIATRILSDIEHEAQDIIPKSLRANDFWFPIRFDWLGRLAELEALGLVKDVIGFLGNALPKQCIRIDAAHLIKRQLESIELRGLMENHITEHELMLLDESVDWA